MQRSKPLLFLLGFLALLAVPFAYYPAHDLLGRLNTEYSSTFSDSAFDQISYGTPRAVVVEKLGAPFQRGVALRYPVWALRTDEATRNRYGRDTLINIDVLKFTRAKNPGRDYELAEVVFGPEDTVLETAQWVTD